MAADHMTDPLFDRIRFTGKPVAHPACVVESGDVRFTVLSSRLLRLEWSDEGAFEDRATFAFPNRRADPVPYEVRRDGGWLVLETGELVLRYLAGSGKFTASNLEISLNVAGEFVRWSPGTPSPSNLRGTRRTLDRCAGDAALEEGILSRSGWAVHDDSRSVVFDEDGWVAPRSDHDVQDWYFFGYGRDYRGGLADYLTFGGEIPLIPRYVLGLWWSRYWMYSDQDLRDLVGEFEDHQIPLDVLVVDMDWHLPDTWTGYTWNRSLFPDPPAFLDWVHSKGLRTTFNLHPAQGIQAHEAMYDSFADAVGADTRRGQPVPFRIADKRFVEAYFRQLHHPMEDDGVDFWWIDWQQGEVSEVRGLDPLPWLNHLHFNDSTRRGTRAMLYSRWGGLGNHRYHIGFSGDTFVTWDALQFQPYLTAAASNVAYGWWSHDIGGHMGGATDPELFARWVQFGAVSPCLRLHATKDPRAKRRPWTFPDEVYRASKSAIELRYRLIPYIYSVARVATETGLSLCRPMYYEHPNEDAAYASRYQYYFGDQAIVAPLVFPSDPATGMASTDIWVPPGTWIDFATKESFEGPRWVRVVGDLQRVPILVRAGGILPLSVGFSASDGSQLASGPTDALRTDRVEIAVFPGSGGSFRLYEDDGVSEEVRRGQFEWTDIKASVPDDQTWEVSIGPVAGRCDGLPRSRTYDVRFVGCRLPDRVTVDGSETDSWRYDKEDLSTVVTVPNRSKDKPVAVAVYANGGVSALGRDLNSDLIGSDVRRLLGAACAEDAMDLGAAVAAEGAGAPDAVARLGGPFARFIEFVTPEEAAVALGRVIIGAPEECHGQYSARAVFRLHGRGHVPEVVVERQDLDQALILDVPFGYVGPARPLWWSANVEVQWAGGTSSFTHTSRPLFPSVYAWSCDLEGASAGQGRPGGEGSRPLALVQHTSSVDQGIHEPFLVNLATEYPHLVEEAADGGLVARLAATVVAPSERDAIVRFACHGEARLSVNGLPVKEALLDLPATDPPPFFQATRTSERVRLQEGPNLLVVRAGSTMGWHGPMWHFGAAFATPDGEPMADLTCCAGRLSSDTE